MYETLCVISSLGYIEITKVCDVLLDYGRIECQKTLKALEMLHTLSTMFRRGLVRFGVLKVLLPQEVMQRELWKVRPIMGFNACPIMSLNPTKVVRFL